MPSARRPRRSTSRRTRRRWPQLPPSPRRSQGMDELEALRVRDEVLQAMYWMRAEGIDATPSAEVLSRFLAVPAKTLEVYLERFVRDGYLERSGAGLRMTARGEETGKRAFADEFAGLTG